MFISVLVRESWVYLDFIYRNKQWKDMSIQYILQTQAFIYTVNTLYHWPKAEFMPERTRGTERLCQTQTYLSFPSNRDETEPYQHRAAHSDQYTQTQLCNPFYTPAHLDLLHSVSLNQISTFKSISKVSGWHKETDRNSSGVTFND